MENLIGNIVTEVLLPPIKRHFDYVWGFDDNIEGLKEEERSLKRQRRQMDQNIEEARLRAESTSIDVQDWLNESTRKLEEAERILGGSGDLKPWHVISRYKLGKSAKEAAQGISRLRDRGKSMRVHESASPASMASISHRPTMEFKSRTRNEEDIINYLEDATVRVIAVCGAGGVGKTTVVRRIEERVKEEKLFDEVVHVVVSRRIDMDKIQKEIAQILGLKLNWEKQVGIAHELRTRLLDKKRKLIVFDDVWESFEVEELGVPFRGASVRCKIILTSRSKVVCREMGAHKDVEIELLDEEEAWTLFRESAGKCVDDRQLILLAKEVAKECSGLPLALVTVGKALENEENICVWNDSLFQLKSPGTMEIPEVLEKVYKPLRLSYDSLKPESAKSLFLLCCLFPEDDDIPIEQLTWYGIGLGMFKEIGSIEKKRNRTHYYVKTLKSRFLLMDGARDNHVRMHDVVRDVAIFIGSEEKDVFLKSLKASSMNSPSNLSSANCKWMSIEISNGNAELSLESGFPNLQLLMIRSHGRYANANRLGLEVMEELNVLSLTRVNLMSISPSLELLKKLTTMVLYNCQVEDISAVGKLSSLEILSIHRCHEIKKLPSAIGRLKCLKVLELTDCTKLKRIAKGVLSSLSKLEELKIINYEYIWQGVNMVLKELESLLNLTSLEINRIYDPNFLAQEISLSQKLIRYNIDIPHPTLFGEEYFIFYPSSFLPRKHERNITLSLSDEDTEIGNWMRQLVRSTQTLGLQGDGSNNINLAQIEDLRHLTLQCCSTVKKLGNAIDCKFLPVLEHLHLEDLDEFEAVVDDDIIPEGSNSFQKLPKSLDQNISLGNLKSIAIYRCHKLCHLFSVATARSLVQLEELEIEECEKIEQVFLNEIESNRGNSSIINVELPKLKKLRLCDLPKLEVLSQIIECPQLTDLQVVNCPKYTTKIGNCCTRQLQEVTIDLAEFEAVVDGDIIPKGSNSFQKLETLFLDGLGNLKKISISGCDKLCHLFSVATARSLVQLEELEIVECEKMEQVFLNEIESNRGNASIINVELPKLKMLWLRDLPNLEILSQIIECPQLTLLQVWNCPKFRTKIGNCCTRQLQKLHIYNCEKIEEIFSDGVGDVGTDRHIIFSELTDLRFENLPRVTSLFSRGVGSIKFPKLINMVVDGEIDSDSKYFPNDDHDQECLHLFCNPQVEVPNVRCLSLSALQNTRVKMWCSRIPINFFHNLVELHIFLFNGIRNLMSYSIANNLVNLQELSIECCGDMIGVIEDGEEIVTPLFPKLKWLRLEHLGKLKSLCKWTHAIELPSLERVQIEECDEMETFTLGRLVTTKLSEFFINYEKVETKDLNHSLRNYYISKRKG